MAGSVLPRAGPGRTPGYPLDAPGAAAYHPEEMAKACTSGSQGSRRSALRAKVRARAENRPGVYRMLGAGGEVLYVGKSVRVRSRLLSYFRAPPGEKAAEVIRAAARVTWEYVPNEFHALVRELRLIRRWHPRYNVEHTRRLRYAYVKVTAEPAPRIVPVTRVVADGGVHYGPFPRPGRLGSTLRELAHVLGLRDCAGDTPVRFGDQLEIFGGGRPPRCMRAETKSCLAPCAGRCSEEEYRARVRVAHRFLEGRSREPLEWVTRAMEAAARRREFEYAALLRDRRERLRALQERLVGFRGRIDGLSFLYRLSGHGGYDRIYLIRRGRVRDHLPPPREREAREAAARRIREIYTEPEPGPVELSPVDTAEILLVARWFRQNPGELERTRSPDAWLAGERSGPGPKPLA